MELYLDLRSQPCRSVFLFARAVGIPFEFKLVDLSKGTPPPPSLFMLVLAEITLDHFGTLKYFGGGLGLAGSHGADSLDAFSRRTKGTQYFFC